MASKKKSAKSAAKKAIAPVRRRAAAKSGLPATAAPAAQGTPSPAAPESKASRLATRDARLPPVGTVISKLDRSGRERARCTILEGGVGFKGVVYKSISAAAMAAAKTLGLASKSLDGYARWGLKKVARSETKRDPAVALARLFERYVERATAAAQVENADQRTKVHEVLVGHVSTLLALTGTSTT